MRDIEPTHWTLDTIYAEAVATMRDDDVCVEVRAEVPKAEHGERLPRRGNRWYGTDVDLTVAGAQVTLAPEEARALAWRLLQAAQHCDLTDLPDTDVCGHWWPCDCRQEAPR